MLCDVLVRIHYSSRRVIISYSTITRSTVDHNIQYSTLQNGSWKKNVFPPVEERI